MAKSIKTGMVESKAPIFEEGAVEESAAGLGILSMECHRRSVNGGWWHDGDGNAIERSTGELLCLIHSEISEAMEGERKDLMDDKLPRRRMAEVELADALIRIFDYAGACGFDLGAALLEKLEFNANRADHKRENRELAGGKAF